MKKIKFFLLMASLLFAQYPSTMTDSFIQGTIKAEKQQAKIFSDDTPEVIYEHIKTALNENTQVQKASYVNIYYVKKQKRFIKTTKNKHHYVSFYLNGYCELPYKVTVSRLSQFVYLRCNFNKGKGTLAALLVPDLYSKALVGKPIYVVLNNKRYYVKGGVIMNAQKTSINIASVINDRKIEKFIAKTGIDTANIVTKQALAYLQAKQQSEQQQQAYYDQNTSNPIVITNYQKPQVKDYVQTAGIQILSQIIQNVSNSFFINLPYLFEVNKNTIFYTDLYVTDKYQGLPNLNVNTNSLDVKKNETIQIKGGFEKK